MTLPHQFTYSLADLGFVRFGTEDHPAGAGFLIDDRHIMTCAHVINAAQGIPWFIPEQPDAVGPVAVRVDRDWVEVKTKLTLWKPRTKDRRADIAVVEIVGDRPEATAVPLRWPVRSENRPFSVQGFPGKLLVGATGSITNFTIGREWVQLEANTANGRAVTEGFSGAPVWDTELHAVVGMVAARDAAAPQARIAAMIPVDLLAHYCPGLVPSRLALDPAFAAYWDPRARGVEKAAVTGAYFTDRQRALSELVKWITGEPDRADNLRIVTGGPGSGKSGVLAQLVTRSEPGFRERHPITADDPLFAVPVATVDAAVYALSLGPAQIVRALAETVNSTADSAAGLINDLASFGRGVTFIVDGLDESIDKENAAKELRDLAWQARDLGLRLLVGTRPGYQHKWRRALGAAANARAIDLDSKKYFDLTGLQLYVRRRLMLEGAPTTSARLNTPYRDDPETADLIASRVAARAYPSFLVAQLTTVGILDRPTVIDVSEPGWDDFPTNVNDAMRDYLDRFPLAERDQVEDLLRPLAYIYGDGLPFHEIWVMLANQLAGHGHPQYRIDDVAWLLNKAADYLIEATVGSFDSGPPIQVYRLYHQALVDYMLKEDLTRQPDCPGSVYFQLRESVPPGAQGQLDWRQAHPYIRTYMADHAAATGHLDELTRDPEFLLNAYPVTLTARLEEDPAITTPGARTYRVAAHFLRDPADRLFQLQLYAARLGEHALVRSLAGLRTDARHRFGWTHEPDFTEYSSNVRHTGGIWAVTVAVLKGQPVAVTGGSDHSIRVWNITTGKPICAPLTGHTDTVLSLAHATMWDVPVVVSSAADSTVRIWNIATGQPIGPPFAGSAGVSLSVAAGHLNGRDVVVTGGADGVVRVWDAQMLTEVGSPGEGHIGEVRGVHVVDIQGRPTVVSGGRDSTVRLWDLATLEPIGDPIKAHVAGVWYLTIADVDGRPVAVSAGADSTVRVIDLIDRACVGKPIADSAFAVWAVAVTTLHGRPVAVTGSDMTLRVWDLATGEPVGEPISGHTGEIWGLDIAQLDGRPVAVSAGGDSVVRVWDLADATSLSRADAERTSGMWSAAAAILDGEPIVVSGGTDSALRIWNLATGNPIGDPLMGHSGGVWVVRTTEVDGRPFAVSVGGDSTVRLWDLASRHQYSTPLTEHTGGVWAIAVTHLNGRAVLFTGGADATIRMWDLVSHAPLGDPIRGHTGGIKSLAMLALGRRQVLISGGIDGTVRVWDLEARAPFCDPFTSKDGNGGVWSVAAATFDGRGVIAAACADSTLRLWDLNSRAELGGGPLTGHSGGAWKVALTEVNGRPVLVSCGDSTVRVWDIATGTPLDVVHLDVVVMSLATCPDARLVIAHGGGLTAIHI